MTRRTGSSDLSPTNKAGSEKLYDFELMMDSGRLAGYRVDDPALERGALDALQALADPVSSP